MRGGGIGSFVDRALLGAAYKRYNGWAHGIAATGAIAADVLYPLGEICGWLFVVVIGIAIILAIVIWRWKIRSELAATALLFSTVTAFLSGAMWGLEHYQRDPHGFLAHMFPRIKDLQAALVEISHKQDRVIAKLDETADQLKELRGQIDELKNQLGQSQSPQQRNELKDVQRQNETAISASCSDLRRLRNTFYKARLYCFKSPQLIAEFGNEGCRYENETDVPLSPYERQVILKSRESERAYGCSF